MALRSRPRLSALCRSSAVLGGAFCDQSLDRVARFVGEEPSVDGSVGAGFTSQVRVAKSPTGSSAGGPAGGVGGVGDWTFRLSAARPFCVGALAGGDAGLICGAFSFSVVPLRAAACARWWREMRPLAPAPDRSIPMRGSPSIIGTCLPLAAAPPRGAPPLPSATTPLGDRCSFVVALAARSSLNRASEAPPFSNRPSLFSLSPLAMLTLDQYISPTPRNTSTAKTMRMCRQMPLLRRRVGEGRMRELSSRPNIGEEKETEEKEEKEEKEEMEAREWSREGEGGEEVSSGVRMSSRIGFELRLHTESTTFTSGRGRKDSTHAPPISAR